MRTNGVKIIHASYWWERWLAVTYTPCISLVCSSEENDINPKVLQLIHGEKIKVRGGQRELSSTQTSSTGILGLQGSCHKGQDTE